MYENENLTECDAGPNVVAIPPEPPEPTGFYSEMTERELLERVARNTDQIIGAVTGFIDMAKPVVESLAKKGPLGLLGMFGGKGF